MQIDLGSSLGLPIVCLRIGIGLAPVFECRGGAKQSNPLQLTLPGYALHLLLQWAPTNLTLEGLQGPQSRGVEPLRVEIIARVGGRLGPLTPQAAWRAEVNRLLAIRTIFPTQADWYRPET